MEEIIKKMGENMYNKDGIIKENYDKEDIEIIRDFKISKFLSDKSKIRF